MHPYGRPTHAPILCEVAVGVSLRDEVVSLSSDHPQEFVDLVHRLRYTEASMYTLSDTPVFTRVKKELAGVLDDLG